MSVDTDGKARYNQKMRKLARLRNEKRRLLGERDAALSPRRRMELGVVQASAARAVFMAGMAARGFNREEALREWRRAPIRP